MITLIKDPISKVSEGKVIEDGFNWYQPGGSSITITTDWGSYCEGLQSWLHLLRILNSITTLYGVLDIHGAILP